MFAMQGVGNILSSAVMYILLSTGMPLDAVWRTALAFGAVPGVITVYFRWKMHETAAFQKSHAAELAEDASDDDNEPLLTGGEVTVQQHEPHHHHSHHMNAVRRLCNTLHEYRWVLLGTAGSWFIFDVTFYANGKPYHVAPSCRRHSHGRVLTKRTRLRTWLSMLITYVQYLLSCDEQACSLAL